MKIEFPAIDKYIQEDDQVVYADEMSQEYINIPHLMMTHGPGLIGALRMRLPVIHKMIGCMKASHRSAASIVSNPKLGKKVMTQEALHALEHYIQSLGIDAIGYAQVPASLIFKDHKILYGHAIVLVMEMEKERIETAPSKVALKEVFRTYHGLGLAVNKIAAYMRQEGYNAMAGPAIGGDVNYVPLAEKAGLGAMGKHGLLITDKGYGPSLRLATVYTDIENLPFARENPYMWIKDFCKQCKKCVRNCPGKAIYNETMPNGRSIDQIACAKPFATDYGCSLCIKNCTFFNNEYEVIKQQFLSKQETMRERAFVSKVQE